MDEKQAQSAFKKLIEKVTHTETEMAGATA